VAAGRAAVVVLAGGQGTRLGSSAPKGCFDIGLPSGLSLYALLAGRVRKLRELAAATAAAGGSGGGGGGDGAQPVAAAAAAGTETKNNNPPPLAPLVLYVMTSRATHAATVAHFAAADNFGLGADGVAFVCQGELPVTGAPGTPAAGRVLLATPSAVARAPDGNGGLYTALARAGALDRMASDGVDVVDVVCVDNALAAPGDPTFLGACLGAGPAFAVGCRALRRAGPAEKVGVFARDAAGGLRVLEYSELSPADAAATVESGNETGNGKPPELLYGWANICMHAFSLAFLQSAAAGFEGRALYHGAVKPVPTVDGPTPATKLELFIFDAFDAAGTAPGAVVVAAVDRAAAFAPVKAATGVDTPADARAALLARGAAWAVAAGATVATASGGVEVVPAVSLCGEGLEGLCGGRVVEEEGDAALGGRA
jgi:UDP-N-acetylglucosamine/UDP-N-acetylgalactosamine diphosphorylase